jgi:alpha-D-ribose 1-methylphosphonate 5-triphosphate synthase subunit PhnH
MTSTTLDLADLPAGFAHPAFDAQASFRRVLDAMARPGRIQRLDVSVRAPDALHPAGAAIALTLFDQDTPVWLTPTLAAAGVRAYLAFHCGCQFAPAPEQARFVFAAGWAELPPLAALEQGTDHYPDRSCTVVLQMDGFATGTTLELRGPGIASVHSLRLSGCGGAFLEQWRSNQAQFPRGVDLLCVHGEQIVGLPSTVRITPTW